MLVIKPGEHGSTFGGNRWQQQLWGLQVVKDGSYPRMQQAWYRLPGRMNEMIRKTT
jgi:hypothetical protein